MPIILTPNPPVANPAASSRLLTLRNIIDGVPTDFDTTPILRDPTRAFGVIRADGGIVVAADGVNNVFTWDDVGVYHFMVGNLTPGVTYTAWVETVTDGATERNPTTWVAGTALAAGYYASREKMLDTAGTEQFNAEMRLDPYALVADEGVVQNALNNADTFVDHVCFVEGIKQAGTPPHYIATSHVAFPLLSPWASRWARADGHTFRGETSDPAPEDVPGAPPGGLPNAAEGVFRRMKTEAETRIREIIVAMRGRDYNGGKGITVGYQPCVRPAYGVQGIVVG